MNTLKPIILSVLIVTTFILSAPQAVMAMEGGVPPIELNSDVNGREYVGTLIAVAKSGGSTIECPGFDAQFEIGLSLTLHKKNNDNKTWHFDKLYTQDANGNPFCNSLPDIWLPNVIAGFLGEIAGDIEKGKYSDLYIKDYSNFIDTSQNYFCTITGGGDNACTDLSETAPIWGPPYAIIMDVKLVGIK